MLPNFRKFRVMQIKAELLQFLVNNIMYTDPRLQINNKTFLNIIIREELVTSEPE